MCSSVFPCVLCGEKTGARNREKSNKNENLTLQHPEFNSSIQHRLARALQWLQDFLRVLRLDPNVFQRGPKVGEEQIEVLVFHALNSSRGMRPANVLAGVNPSSEQHRHEHDLPRAQVRHVRVFKEMAKIFILQHSFVEALSRGLDRFMPAD